MTLIADQIDGTAARKSAASKGQLRRARRQKLSPLAAIALIVFPAGFLNAQDAGPDSGFVEFSGYPDAPQSQVVSRKDELFFYPCDQCHAVMEPDPTVRRLVAPHDAELDHGQGRMWCMQCHEIEDRNMLRSLLGNPVDFDDAHLVCGGCHANRHKDWYFGVHGKRLESWQGERTVYSCTHCHNPHSPAIELRAPSPAPAPRAGLELKEGEIHRDAPVWERNEEHQE